MKFSHLKVLKWVQLFNYVAFIFGMWYIVHTGEWHWLLISYLLTYLYQGVGAEAGFHRLWAHKMYETTTFWKWVLGYLGTLSTQSTPVTYGAAHRQHHKYSDQEGDPHSPHRIGIWRCLFAQWEHVDIKPKMYIDLLRDPVCKFFTDHYFKTIFVTCILFALIDPLWVLFGYCVPAALSLWVGGFTNTFGHIKVPFVYRNFETTDKSLNTWLVAVATCFTIGWHNNHHAKDRYLNNGGVKWWEFDLNYYVCKLIMTKEILPGSLKDEYTKEKAGA